MTRITSETKPNPGSDEAISAGCTCPVIDNAHGKGFRGRSGEFVMFDDCPIHGSAAEAAEGGG